MLSIPVEELIRWNDLTALHWRDLARAHPELLSVPCDIRSSGTAAKLLQHIVAVELRYAQRLASEPESDYDAVPFGTPDEIFATHVRALGLVHPLLANEAFDWNLEIDFRTLTLGEIRATRQDILLHLLLHSIRHYAQLATIARASGIKPDWPMDFIFLNARRADTPHPNRP
jgi:uncharacterized damage-inducible protein DinB